MPQTHSALTGKRLTTPRAASIAGILFALLFSASVILIRLSLPGGATDSGYFREHWRTNVDLSLKLMPFAGIAFLWFMGVVRDRLGQFEDQFFSTVFFGSGLLFLAMVFGAAAMAGGIVFGFSSVPQELIVNDVYIFGRATMGQFFTMYALRMAGVFVISLGTIWLRTGVMPRWLTFITYGFALILILTVSLSLWMVLVFPLWVLIISIYILVLNLRRERMGGEEDGMTVHLSAE
jgi:hypothetical protein